MELRTYEKAVLLERGLKAVTEVSFSPALFGEGLMPFRSSLVNILATKGPQCKFALVAAVGIFAAASMKGEGLVERAQELAGFVGDACAKISNVMSLPGVVTTIDEVGTAKYKELRDQVAGKVDTALAELGDYLTPDHKAMMRDWLLWGNAHLLNTVAETIRTLPGPDNVAQTLVLLNTLGTFLPSMPDIAAQKKLMEPTIKVVSETMDLYVNEQIKFMNKAAVAEVAPDTEHNRWLSDAVAAAINVVNHGVELKMSDLSKGFKAIKFAPRYQLVGLVVGSQMIRQYNRLQQASREGKY